VGHREEDANYIKKTSRDEEGGKGMWKRARSILRDEEGKRSGQV